MPFGSEAVELPTIEVLANEGGLGAAGGLLEGGGAVLGAGGEAALGGGAAIGAELGLDALLGPVGILAGLAGLPGLLGLVGPNQFGSFANFGGSTPTGAAANITPAQQQQIFQNFSQTGQRIGHVPGTGTHGGSGGILDNLFGGTAQAATNPPPPPDMSAADRISQGFSNLRGQAEGVGGTPGSLSHGIAPAAQGVAGVSPTDLTSQWSQFAQQPDTGFDMQFGSGGPQVYNTTSGETVGAAPPITGGTNVGYGPAGNPDATPFGSDASSAVKAPDLGTTPPGSIPGGAGTTPGAASPGAAGAKPEPSFFDKLAGGAENSLFKNPLGIGLAGGLLGYDLLKGNKKPPEQGILGQVAMHDLQKGDQLTGQGQSFVNYLSKGTLPPGQQAQLDMQTQSATAQARSNAAAMGMPADPMHNTMLAGKMADIEQQSLATKGAIEGQLAQAGAGLIGQGANFAGLGANAQNIYSQLLAQDDQAWQKAIAGLAAAFSPGISLNLGKAA